jgi:bcr-type benzoyl-CoA reductase subunit C
MRRGEALNRIAEVAQNPLESTARWKQATGGKVVGCLACMPPFAPEELVHAAGMLPVGLWGAEIPVRLADAKLQIFACSVARTSLEMGIDGTLSICDAFLFPSTCDAFQNLSEVWRFATEGPCFEVTFPKQKDTPAARRYLARELERLQAELEVFSGAPVSEASLRASIRLYNEHRKLMRKLDEKRGHDPGCLSARQMTETVLAASFLPKEEHASLVKALLNSSPDPGHRDPAEAVPGGQSPVRVYLSGIMARPRAIPEVLDALGVWVVGDDLGLGSLYYGVDVPEGGLPRADLAEGYLRYPPCSTVHPSSPERSRELIRRVRQTRAQGVLILATKFCEPEFFDVPQLKDDLEEAGIPSLLLETELGMTEPGSVRTRVEAFVETLRERQKGKGPMWIED